MIERTMAIDLGKGRRAAINSKGQFALTVGGRKTVMTEAEARRLWSNLGTLLREAAKWNG